MAGLRLLQKQLRLWLFWWSGFSGGAGAVLENVWQNNFTCWIEVVNCLNWPFSFSFLFSFFFLFLFSPLLFFFFSFFFFPPLLLSIRPRLLSSRLSSPSPTAASSFKRWRPPEPRGTASFPSGATARPPAGTRRLKLPLSATESSSHIRSASHRSPPPWPGAARPPALPRRATGSLPASGSRRCPASAAGETGRGRRKEGAKASGETEEPLEPRGATISWLRPPCGSRNRLQVRLLVRSRWKIHRLAVLRVKPLPELLLKPCQRGPCSDKVRRSPEERPARPRPARPLHPCFLARFPWECCCMHAELCYARRLYYVSVIIIQHGGHQAPPHACSLLEIEHGQPPLTTQGHGPMHAWPVWPASTQGSPTCIVQAI